MSFHEFLLNFHEHFSRAYYNVYKSMKKKRKIYGLDELTSMNNDFTSKIFIFLVDWAKFQKSFLFRLKDETIFYLNLKK